MTEILQYQEIQLQVIPSTPALYRFPPLIKPAITNFISEAWIKLETNEN